MSINSPLTRDYLLGQCLKTQFKYGYGQQCGLKSVQVGSILCTKRQSIKNVYNCRFLLMINLNIFFSHIIFLSHIYF